MSSHRPITCGQYFWGFSLGFIVIISIIFLFLNVYGSFHQCYHKLQHNDSPVSNQKQKRIIINSSNTVVFRKQNEDLLEKCAAGHLKGLAPRCGADGCLKILEGPNEKVAKDIPTLTRYKILFTEGWLNEVHIVITKELTTMQWSFGIYGSVGEIGVYFGKYSAVLASFMATDYGERIFICDIFGNQKHMNFKTEEGRKDIFEGVMNVVGFSMFSNKESKHIRVWDDSSLYLTKSLYVAMDLPAFRFFSIDGNHHEAFVLHDLTHVTCILREGGIIAVDDFLNLTWPGVKKAINLFFRMYGTDVIRPSVIQRPKLYFCSASWHSTFMKYIKEKKIDKLMGWCDVTSNFTADLEYKFNYFEYSEAGSC